jgi:hypothetical protein
LYLSSSVCGWYYASRGVSAFTLTMCNSGNDWLTTAINHELCTKLQGMMRCLSAGRDAVWGCCAIYFTSAAVPVPVS